MGFKVCEQTLEVFSTIMSGRLPNMLNFISFLVHSLTFTITATQAGSVYGGLLKCLFGFSTIFYSFCAVSLINLTCSSLCALFRFLTEYAVLKLCICFAKRYFSLAYVADGFCCVYLTNFEEVPHC